MVYILEGGACVPCPPLVYFSGSLLFSFCYFLCVQILAGGRVYIHVPDRAVCPDMAKRLGRSEDVVWS